MNENNKKRGWVKVYRSVTDSWIWNDKPYSKGQAWIDILLMVNHEERNIGIGNQIITVKKGSFVTSMLKLSDRWGWSKQKVNRFLKQLESDSKVILNMNRKWTTVTLVNWGSYQNECNTDGTQVEQSRNTNGTQVGTNKNKEQRTKNFFTPKPNKFNQFQERERSKKDYVDLERRKLNGG